MFELLGMIATAQHRANLSAATDAALLEMVAERSAPERLARRAVLDDKRRGEHVTATTVAPSPFVSTVATRKVGRGKKGPRVTVTRRGKVWTVGDSRALDDQTTRNGRVPRVVIAHAIDELRAGNRFGHVDGDALAALTTRLYDVPELIGTDSWSWSQSTPEIPSSGAAVLAAQTCGITAGIAPMVDRALLPDVPLGHVRKPRQWPTRRRVTMPRARQSDPLPREHVQRGVWTWEHVTELPAGTDDAATIWHGHRKVTRGESKTRPRHAVNGPRDAFLIADDVNLADALASLAAVVKDDGAGRYTWRVVDTDTHGRITVDKRGRVSVVGAGFEVRQADTLDALRRKLAH
jgi:hypothetical protein